jgi:mannose-6-phosphate isomerase-like protein (cupin superfamily)
MTSTSRRTALAGAALLAGGLAEAQSTAAAGAEPVIRRRGEGRTHWMVGDRLTLRISGAETGGRFSLMELYVVPGGGPPPHIHGRESETFHVLEGEVTLTLGDETVRAGPGTTVHVPAGVPHAFRNDSSVPLRMGMVIAPAGFEDFFAEAGVPTRADDVTPAPADAARIARIVGAAGRYGTTFLPPR